MSYWNHVTRLLESTMDNRTDIGNAEKADLLRNELAKINTSDHFYVVVYNDCTGYDKHSLYYNLNKTLVVECATPSFMPVQLHTTIRKIMTG